jgi:transcriptional antiterminator NusG
MHCRLLVCGIVPPSNCLLSELTSIDEYEGVRETMASLNRDSNWFALHVRSKTEYQVSRILRSKGYEEFLPICRTRKNGRSYEAPLFPGYLFCRTTPQIHGLIVTTPGVIRIVGCGGKPSPIDVDEVRSVQLLVSSGAAMTGRVGLHLGDMVRVEDGPLRGLVGVLTAIRSEYRLVVSITMMMRTVVAEVSAEWVKVVTRLSTPNADQLMSA